MVLIVVHAAVYNRIIVILKEQWQIWIVVHITEYLWFHNIQYERMELEISTVQWGLHLQISSTSEPLMRISFHF